MFEANTDAQDERTSQCQIRAILPIRWSTLPTGLSYVHRHTLSH